MKQQRTKSTLSNEALSNSCMSTPHLLKQYTIHHANISRRRRCCLIKFTFHRSKRLHPNLHNCHMLPQMCDELCWKNTQIRCFSLSYVNFWLRLLQRASSSNNGTVTSCVFRRSQRLVENLKLANYKEHPILRTDAVESHT